MPVAEEVFIEDMSFELEFRKQIGISLLEIEKMGLGRWGTDCKMMHRRKIEPLEFYLR